MRVDVRFLRGARAGQQLTLESTWPVRIGRHPDNHVTFHPERDRLVSSFHAELRLEGGRVTFQDLGSANGSFVNQQRVTEVRLDGPLQVTFGDNGPKIQIQVVQEAAAASTGQPAPTTGQSQPALAAPAPTPASAPASTPAPAAARPAAVRSSHLGLAITLGVLLVVVIGVGVTLFALKPMVLFGGDREPRAATAPGPATTDDEPGPATTDDEPSTGAATDPPPVTDPSAPPLVAPRAAAPTVINVPYKETRATVTPAAGGKVVAQGATLSVPPGAVAQETQVLLRRLEGPFPGAPEGSHVHGPIPLGAAYDLGPDGITFTEPVRLTMSFADAELPQGATAKNIRMVYFNGKRWVEAPAAVDLKARTASAAFSAFPGLLVELILGAVIVTAYGIVATKLVDHAKADPNINGTANQWITPKDPVVQRFAKEARFQVEGGSESRSLDAADAGQWLKGKKVRIMFGKDHGHYDDNEGTNWQKPRDYLTKGSSKGPMHGDCTDATNAMVSIFQAMGYKARGVYGYEDGDSNNMPHAWGEVVIGDEAYYIDEAGGLMQLQEARKTYNYKPSSDPSDPRYKSTWDGTTQGVYNPNWFRTHTKRLGDKPMRILTPRALKGAGKPPPYKPPRGRCVNGGIPPWCSPHLTAPPTQARQPPKVGP